LRVAGCGLRVAGCGLRVAGCGLRVGTVVDPTLVVCYSSSVGSATVPTNAK